jgi:hypothetical protein
MNKSFWITNISNKNIVLGDLNITIQAGMSINLLKYNFSLEQLNKSYHSGSLFRKRDKLILGKQPPQKCKHAILINYNAVIPSRERSIEQIKQQVYEELNISDEDFAKENADISSLE